MSKNKQDAIASLDKAVAAAHRSIVAGALAVGAEAVLGALCNKLGVMSEDRNGTVASSTIVLVAIDEEVWQKVLRPALEAHCRASGRRFAVVMDPDRILS